MSPRPLELDCDAVDELAAAFALGAVDTEIDAAFNAHLARCRQPHADSRELIAAATLVPASLEPELPSPELRDRLMASIARTAQEHRQSPARGPVPAYASRGVEPRRRWWQLSPLPTAVAAVALAAAVGLGVWGNGLSTQLAARDEALRAVASADALHAAAGRAGTGWVMEHDGRASFLAAELEPLPEGSLYELWLMDADGLATPVGTLTDGNELSLLRLEHGLAGAATFAITVEPHRVDTPTSDPVVVAALGT